MIQIILFIVVLSPLLATANHRNGPHPPSNDILYYPDNFEPCQYECPTGYYSTSRNYEGKENVWCIKMKGTTDRYSSNLFGNLDIQCKKERSVLTGFQNHTEYTAVYDQFKSSFSWISTEKPMVIIGARRKDECRRTVNPACSSINGNQWTDGVTTGTDFFQTPGFLERTNRIQTTVRKCVSESGQK
uniref:C-type lectin domain-containing protein n=1 Tax=Caenorhabditis tropicalis TaxID=1561998 RepID=A0A1I7T3Y1_9PELO